MFKYYAPVTPAEVSPTLSSLINELVPGGSAVYVDVKPLDDAPADECFYLVEAQCKLHGGRPITGWALWELPTLFVEAEFHSVWEMPDGTLVDVTPKSSQTTKVFFLADPHKPYKGRQVNNARRPIKPDSLLSDYFETFNRQFELLNRGDRIGQHGEVHLEGEEAHEISEILQLRERLFSQLGPRFPSANPYFPCPCGSGKKTKWCHKRVVNTV